MTGSASTNGEKLIRIVNQHWIKYVIPVFIYVVLLSVCLLLFILAGMTTHHSMWISHLSFVVALICFLVTHHWFFLTLVCESATHVVVTNHRVVWMHDLLFVDEQMMEYAFDKMNTVEARKHGVLQTILRYGTLQFESGTDVPLVPHPNSVIKDIEQAMGLK
ncbi:hypothetical protein A3H22_04455 [Candidatus Peribacteria bacterium RIFCSPLOWO2_12_FULL_55_15]|nr:MAG: hypothetical protein A2789_01870 [Candidatus Peribacteria bacterium RIFCSPHIGHO2_01_FULL_54_22]OGJ62313.1 MAG: hypothetical protein A3D12_02130 [Candidatus Peribacteria bacterium RIFCSPHIGHO2_02_FULL_55_24]OGJ64922.1 MAG: hypothetical protein A3E47_03415 [Candidatus Peribacteria bacterium RIFCSPHIGHO2_12_FULL_54_10]OGJ67732.1 MAG: hypothetical protein A2947_03385 [Candidatus Peribacteria bacterium RIFCSPLOWO2_01_FULL_54_110]OGJ68894.1 MAG: hypothetical protein A3H90_01965 [Candidatus Pe